MNIHYKRIFLYIHRVFLPATSLESYYTEHTVCPFRFMERNLRMGPMLLSDSTVPGRSVIVAVGEAMQ